MILRGKHKTRVSSAAGGVSVDKGDGERQVNETMTEYRTNGEGKTDRQMDRKKDKAKAGTTGQ